jgi:hypothetical protein
MRIPVLKVGLRIVLVRKVIMSLGRPQQYDFEAFRPDLTSWYREGATFEELAERLNAREGVQVGVRTIQRWFAQWGETKRQTAIDLATTPDLEAQIKFCFWMLGLDNMKMLDHLRKAGYDMNRDSPGKFTVIYNKKRFFTFDIYTSKILV